MPAAAAPPTGAKKKPPKPNDDEQAMQPAESSDAATEDEEGDDDPMVAIAETLELMADKYEGDGSPSPRFTPEDQTNYNTLFLLGYALHEVGLRKKEAGQLLGLNIEFTDDEPPMPPGLDAEDEETSEEEDEELPPEEEQPAPPPPPSRGAQSSAYDEEPPIDDSFWRKSVPDTGPSVSELEALYQRVMGMINATGVSDETKALQDLVAQVAELKAAPVVADFDDFDDEPDEVKSVALSDHAFWYGEWDEEVAEAGADPFVGSTKASRRRTFDESRIVRDKHGRFASKPGGESALETLDRQKKERSSLQDRQKQELADRQKYERIQQEKHALRKRAAQTGENVRERLVELDRQEQQLPSHAFSSRETLQKRHQQEQREARERQREERKETESEMRDQQREEYEDLRTRQRQDEVYAENYRRIQDERESLLERQDAGEDVSMELDRLRQQESDIPYHLHGVNERDLRQRQEREVAELRELHQIERNNLNKPAAQRTKEAARKADDVRKSPEVRSRARNTLNRGIDTMHRMGRAADSTREAARKVLGVVKEGLVSGRDFIPMLAVSAALLRTTGPLMRDGGVIMGRWGQFIKNPKSLKGADLDALLKDTEDFLWKSDGLFGLMLNHASGSSRRVTQMGVRMGDRANAAGKSMRRVMDDHAGVARAGRETTNEMMGTLDAAARVARDRDLDMGRQRLDPTVPDHIARVREDMAYGRAAPHRDTDQFRQIRDRHFQEKNGLDLKQQDELSQIRARQRQESARVTDGAEFSRTLRRHDEELASTWNRHQREKADLETKQTDELLKRYLDTPAPDPAPSSGSGAFPQGQPSQGYGQQQRPTPSNLTPAGERAYQRQLAQDKARQLAERRARGEINHEQYYSEMNSMTARGLVDQDDVARADSYYAQLRRGEVQPQQQSAAPQSQPQQQQQRDTAVRNEHIGAAERSATGEMSDSQWGSYLQDLRQRGYGEAYINDLKDHRRKLKASMAQGEQRIQQGQQIERQPWRPEERERQQQRDDAEREAQMNRIPEGQQRLDMDTPTPARPAKPTREEAKRDLMDKARTAGQGRMTLQEFDEALDMARDTLNDDDLADITDALLNESQAGVDEAWRRWSRDDDWMKSYRPTFHTLRDLYELVQAEEQADFDTMDIEDGGNPDDPTGGKSHFWYTMYEVKRAQRRGRGGWDSTRHPRGPDGRFVSMPGSGKRRKERDELQQQHTEDRNSMRQTQQHERESMKARQDKEITGARRYQEIQKERESLRQRGEAGEDVSDAMRALRKEERGLLSSAKLPPKELERRHQEEQAELERRHHEERDDLQFSHDMDREVIRARHRKERDEEHTTLVEDLKQNHPKAMSKAFGTDPTKTYDMRHKVVDLDSEVTASNKDNGAINSDYDPRLQPRDRSRAASQMQVDKVAREMVPDAILMDMHSIDKGSPIVDASGHVLSGNGRTMALRKMKQQYPEKWNEYQEKLKERAEEYGFSPDDLKGKKNPVLVRELVSDVDTAAFAQDANSPPVLQMSPLERAKTDASRLKDSDMALLNVRDDEGIDLALRRRDNQQFVQSFVSTLPENERALVLRSDGTINKSGIDRIKAAMFTRTFPGESGTRLADTFLEAVDSDTKNIERGITGALPRMAKAESLIQSGARDRELSLSNDFAAAIDTHARIKEAGWTFDDYIRMPDMFAQTDTGRQATADQERVLGWLSENARKPKAIREKFDDYARAVEEAPHPDQADMEGGKGRLTREQLLTRLFGHPVESYQNPMW